MFGQKWLYSGKVVVFGQSGCLWAKWFYSGYLVVFGQKWLYSGKVVVFMTKVVSLRQYGCFGAKVVVFG